MALQNGGVKLDAYDGRLPRLYTQYGFVPVAKILFSKDRRSKRLGFDKTRNAKMGCSMDSIMGILRKLSQVKFATIHRGT